MGTNEPLPPPPPPGQPPNQPPPGFTPPSYTPPQQYPPTQPLPVQPPHQPTYPQPGYAPGGPPPSGPKKNTGLIVGGLVAVAAIVGGIIAFTGGDDKKSSNGPITSESVSTTSTTVVAASTTTESTLVITTPTTVEEEETTTTEEEAAVVTVDDDTGAFSVTLPELFDIDTTPLEGNNVIIARVVGSTNIEEFNDNDDVFGIALFVVGGEIGLSAQQVMDSLAPAEGQCNDPDVEVGRPTSQGAVSVQLYDGCGTGGEFAQVLMAMALDDGTVLCAWTKARGPAGETPLRFTQLVFESIQLN